MLVGFGGAKKNNTADVRSWELKRTAYRLKKCGGSDKARFQIAARHLQLRQAYPLISLPESITWYLLEDQNEEFEPQGQIAGGRSQWGGAVIDFWLPVPRVVLRIQGDWWHKLPGKTLRDAEQKAILQRAVIGGQRVSAVVDLWERALYSCRRDRIVNLARRGIETPKM